MPYLPRVVAQMNQLLIGLDESRNAWCPKATCLAKKQVEEVGLFLACPAAAANLLLLDLKSAGFGGRIVLSIGSRSSGCWLMRNLVLMF